MGTAISPLADDDQIIVHPGYDLLTAFDAQTGDIVWQSGDPGVWALPTMAELDGVRQVVSVACQVVEGVAPVDGAVLWKYPINPQMVHAVTPLVHDGWSSSPARTRASRRCVHVDVATSGRSTSSGRRAMWR